MLTVCEVEADAWEAGLCVVCTSQRKEVQVLVEC